MNTESKDVIQSKEELKLAPFEKERGMFKALLLTNPNYFGNVLESELEPILPISGNTYYEELGCVGYHPQQERLEAVVYIYQPSGYGTDICGPGTPEYVRFYLSYDGGSTWQDQGMTSFQAYNIPEGTTGDKRLEYAVTLPCSAKKSFCFADPLIQARAILSWNNPPPANQPDWNPVWGNVKEVTVLVEPRRLIFPPEIFEIAKIEPHPLIKDILDYDVPIETKTKSISAAELAEHYQEDDIPVHRYAFKEITSFLSVKSNMKAELFAKVLPEIEIDPGIIEKIYAPTDGDISYEELKCIGLDPNHPDTLVGIIQVKKSSGYSGGPCSDGSLEYITFWADFDGNGSFETCLGTAMVKVYDVNVPPEGVYYAVWLPFDLTPYRQKCQQGPRLVRIRAILSWNVAVPCNQPDKVPVWGNREETVINIAPIAGAPAGKIAILGGIPTSFIDDVTGLTTPDAVFATNNLPPDNPDGDINTPDGRPCPFAGRVTVQGAPVNLHSYKVEVTPVGGGAPTAVVTDLILTRQDGTTHVHTADPTTLRFDYLDFTKNINSVLAQWDTTGDARWEVRLTTYDGSGNQIGVDTHLIQLDNTWPEASIEITTGTGNCGKFSIGTLLEGNFVARDEYLNIYKLSVLPNVNPPGVGVPNPPEGLVNTAPAPGNTWSLKTDLMAPCGYVIGVWVEDRAIRNSQSLHHERYRSAGFCLEVPGKDDNKKEKKDKGKG